MLLSSLLLISTLFSPLNNASKTPDAPSIEAFWENLQAHCGLAFSGVVTNIPEGDTQLAGVAEGVLHFETCNDEYVRVPFHVRFEDGTWNRSRTWIYIRTEDGIELRHDHRTEDGAEDQTTWYGGFSHQNATATEANFVSRREGTTSEGPTSGWKVIMEPGTRYVYGTTRRGEWRHRLDFDLSKPIDTPDLPWGYETLPVGLQKN